MNHSTTSIKLILAWALALAEAMADVSPILFDREAAEKWVRPDILRAVSRKTCKTAVASA